MKKNKSTGVPENTSTRQRLNKERTRTIREQGEWVRKKLEEQGEWVRKQKLEEQDECKDKVIISN